MKNLILLTIMVLLGIWTSSIAQPPDFTCDPPKELKQVEGWYTDTGTGALVHYITTYCWDPATNTAKIVANYFEKNPPGIIPNMTKYRNFTWKAILDAFAQTICMKPCLPLSQICQIKTYPCWRAEIDPERGFPWHKLVYCDMPVECEYWYEIICNYPTCDGTYTYSLMREFTNQTEPCPEGCFSLCTGGALTIP